MNSEKQIEHLEAQMRDIVEAMTLDRCSDLLTSNRHLGRLIHLQTLIQLVMFKENLPLRRL